MPRGPLFVLGSSPLARGTRRRLVAYMVMSRFIPARAGNTSAGRPPGSSSPVHPRSRGEHICRATTRFKLTGSSPLARGTRLPVGGRDRPHRFIPARAGNTRPGRDRTERASVHPRSRGEHVNVRLVVNHIPGSSPLARGTRLQHTPDDPNQRFIPARAGNTGTVPVGLRGRPVHPRSRGEHAMISSFVGNSLGSSPLARGTRREHVLVGGGGRFIPARAGNTDGGRCPPGFDTVHPRSRGEHADTNAPVAAAAGSSPLARGTPDAAHHRRSVSRFIPARAGNTAARSSARAPTSVHPRSRGEHPRKCFLKPSPVGSSPLARGTLRRAVARHRPRRFIPARAGNTRSRSRRSGPKPVHPRSRGEHLAVKSRENPQTGSSPLARGTRRGRHRLDSRGRFIPARAGNTACPRTAPPRPPVHPRSRGEHMSGALVANVRIGSSPLARGTQARGARRQALGRFIPARAGNTATWASSATRGTVHPRSRGEHVPSV